MDEFDNIDLDLRDLLDELVNHSLLCISCISMAHLALHHPATTTQDKIDALEAEYEAYAELKEIAYCYQSTIGFH